MRFVGAVIVILAVAYFWNGLQGAVADTGTWGVLVEGDCASLDHEARAPTIARVACDDPNADVRVTRRVVGTTDVQVACGNDPLADDYFTEDDRGTRPGGTRYVLCLHELR